MRVLILYGSLTGNTQMCAEALASHLQSLGHDVASDDQSMTDISSWSQYDLLIWGASTWGEGDPNPSTSMFIETLQASAPVSAPPIAIFGLGDRAYEHYCGVVDHLERLCETLGLRRIGESLRVEGYPDEALYTQINSWAQGAINTLCPSSS